MIMEIKNIANPEIFFTAIGVLATAFATVIGFQFGSSSGSKQKDRMIIASHPQVQAQRGSATVDTGVVDGNLPLPTPRSIPTSIPAKTAPSGTFGLFLHKSPKIMQDLVDDFNLTKFQAAGILGNIGHECAGFRKLQEMKPTVKNSRGGWGWCQWTGPRRRQFEAWCQKSGHDDLSADPANYGFLKHELETTEKNALKHLRGTQSLADATKSFMDKFERPGVKHLDSRIKWARTAHDSTP